jgi:predicted Zn-dependent protease
LKSNHYYAQALRAIRLKMSRARVSALARQFELDADKLAVEYIQKAGLTKTDYLKFLYWMKKNMDSQNHAAKASIFSTHPATQERINELVGNQRRRDLPNK